MPLISGTVPSLINGVSQQPATLRLPTQGETQVNALSHIARGLEKRPCTEHIAEIAGVTSNNSDDVFIHTIRRSEDEAYALIVKGGSTNTVNGATSSVATQLKLIDLTGYATGTAGNEVYIRNNVTVSGGNTTSSDSTLSTDVENYLSTFGPDEVFKPNKLSATTIADFTFLLNKTKVVEQDVTTTPTRDYESLVYFKVGDYGADYKIVIKEYNVYTAAWNTANPTLTGTLGEMNNSSVRQTFEFKFRTPDNKVKSQSGKGNSGNSEGANNSQTVAVSNIAYSMFWANERSKIVKVDLNVGGSDNDPATINVSGAQNVYDQEGVLIDGDNNTATESYADNAVYTGDMGVLAKGVYSSSTTAGYGADSTTPTGSDTMNGTVINTAYEISEGLQAFSKTHLEDDGSAGTTGAGQKHPNFSIQNASGTDLKGDESILHISNNQYPFTVEVTDGKGDSYMRAINGHDEVAQFGYLPGSKVPSGFTAKISGNKSSGQDDYYVAWRDGVWKETAKPLYPGGTASYSHAELLVEARTSLKPQTMPVQLYKNFGIVDGVANNIYFVIEAAPWDTRDKGDSRTNPFPSFANYTGDALYTINDIFFHRNRLGFVSDENVVLSEVGSYFNFFHTTVLSVLDTAVIDVAVSNNQVAILKSAIPFQESLILFSDLQQFKLTSDQFLTPTSVTVDVATNFETSTDAKPVAAGKTIFFPFQRGAYSGIREYFIDVASETNDANEISAHVPEYIDGVVKKLAVSSNEEVLLVLSSTNRKEVAVYKYYYNDKEKLQSAWSKWTFDADVIDVAFVGSVAFFLFRRGNGSGDKVYLEKVNLSVDSAIAVEDDKIGIRLDRRVKLTAADVSTVSGSRVLNMPYTDAQWDKVTTSTVQTSKGAIFGSKVPIDGLNTVGSSSTWVGSFAPRIGQTFTADGETGTTYTVIDTADTVNGGVTIAVAPSISEDSKWDDNKVLTFKEREVEYIVETGEKVEAHQVAAILDSGTKLSIERGNTAPVVYAGIPYNFEYQFSEQFLKNNDNSINSGRLQLRNFEIYYDKTGYFQVTVSPKPHDGLYRDVTTNEFTGVIVGTSLLGNKTLETGVFRVPVYVNSKDVKITVSSDSWYPVALQSADWEAMQVLRSQRI